MRLHRFVYLLFLTATVFCQSRPGFRTGESPAILALSAASLAPTFAPAPPTPDVIYGEFVLYGSGGSSSESVAVADVNGDGKPDVVVANSGNVGVLLGNGDGTFQTAVIYSTGGDTSSVAVADVNGDGKPDIVVANFNTNTVAVLLGNGDGTFQAAVAYASGGDGASSVAVADVNGDGKLDVLVTNECITSTNCANGLVDVLLGNGDGTFQTAVSYSSGGSNAYSVAVADVNGDGKPDLAVANLYPTADCGSSTNCTVAVLLGNGDGTFKPAVTYASGGITSRSIAVADVNGDGKPDLLVANECITSANCGFYESPNGSVGVLLGNGDGTFQPAAAYSSGGYSSDAIAVADVNGDGKPDLVVGNECAGNCGIFESSVGVLLGNGDGTFQSPGIHTEGAHGIVSVAVADVNGDGKPDIVVANNGITTKFQSSTVGVVLNTSEALASLSPSPAALGNVTVNTTYSHNVILTNPGNRPLTIASIGLASGSGSAFVESNNCPAVLSPAASCKILVTFSPTAAGAQDATIVVTDNTSTSPQQVAVTGVGVVPAVTLSSGSVTFPTQLVYTTSAAQVVKLTNSGLGILDVTNIGVTGPFSQTNTCPSSMNSADSCALTVTFNPTTIGPLAGSITITDSAGNSPQRITLSGTGTAVKFAPARLAFGIQPVGTTSLAESFALTNQGHAAVAFTGISITGANPGDFSQTNTCGTSVASGASCFVHVTFTPSATGARSAAVSFSDNGGGSPQTVPVTGTGT